MTFEFVLCIDQRGFHQHRLRSHREPCRSRGDKTAAAIELPAPLRYTGGCALLGGIRGTRIAFPGRRAAPGAAEKWPAIGDLPMSSTFETVANIIPEQIANAIQLRRIRIFIVIFIITQMITDRFSTYFFEP